MQQFATREAFVTYVDYLALKRHFTTTTYDYHKFNGKIRCGLDSFKKRRDVEVFYRLSKESDSHNMLLSNFVEKPKFWVGKILDAESKDIYNDWKRRTQSFEYLFSLDLNKLDDNFQNNFYIRQGENPLLLDLYMRKQIMIETVAVLLKTTNTLEYWKTNISDKIIALDKINHIGNYIPFVKYNEKNIEKKLREMFF